MKKVFLVLFASAAFAFNGCESTHEDAMEDSAEMRNDANEATQMVDTMRPMSLDTMMVVPDTMHK